MKDQLPNGWCYTELGKIIEPSKEKVNPDDIERTIYIGLEHIEKQKGIINGNGYSDEVHSTKSVFRKGDLLYGKLRPYLNKVTYADTDGICSTDILVFPKKYDVNNKLIKYFLMNNEFVKYANKNVSGVQHPRVNFQTISNYKIGLPPFKEQARIVSKIEELLTRLDAGIKSLKQVQILLKKYRQSVLKSAVEGKLTSEWRKQHKDELEPGDKLLERILKERKEKWEAEQLANFKAKGIKPPKDWKDKYKEPSPPDTSKLPELPEGWVWVTFDYIGGLNRGKSKHRPRNDPKLYGGKYPFIQTGDVKQANKFIKSYSKTYNEEGLKQSKLWGQGTLCITIAANIADTAILNFDACFPDSVVGFSPSKSINLFYIEYFLRTAKENLERYAPATAQKNINLEILNQVAIPLPSTNEQVQFVNEVDRLLSIADGVEETLEKEIIRSSSLRQSILKNAFEGKLVPQDLNDEPASVLLERIKAEKATQKN